MHDPHFSVVIPTCNRPTTLLACLSGLGRLSYPRDRYEVVVVNDGSRIPPAEELARATPGIRLRLLHQAHQGPAIARNTGAQAASGRYLAFLDDDCVPHPEWLAGLGHRLERKPDALIGGRTVNAVGGDAFSDATQLMVDFLTHYYDASAPDRTRFFATSNLALGATLFRQTGGFDRQFTYAAGEDRDFCDRWHLAGRPSEFAAEAVVHHYHRLDLPAYLAQHFRYGRGALRFHHARRARRAAVRTPPLSFYLDLVRYPLAHRPRGQGATRAALLLAAQAATAAGYCWEGAVGGSSAWG